MTRSPWIFSAVTRLTLAMALCATAQADCDVEAGLKVFNKCAACHSLEEGVQMMGPSLHGMVGRTVGSAEGFSYSTAMEQADFVWNEETLSAFLDSPMQYLPGTTMPFGGLKKAEQRAALNCLLADRTP